MYNPNKTTKMVPVFILFWIWIDPFCPEFSLPFKRAKEWRRQAALVVNLSMETKPFTSGSWLQDQSLIQTNSTLRESKYSNIVVTIFNSQFSN
jgi:hypothetical protein